MTETVHEDGGGLESEARSQKYFIPDPDRGIHERKRMPLTSDARHLTFDV